jgi:hypothetical protein
MRHDRNWILLLFEDKENKILFKTFSFSTIKELSLVLNEKEQTCSNYYHGLIKPRGVFEYCKIYQEHSQ